MTNTIVEISQGKLLGRKCYDYDGQDYYSFQGIPYAKPPIGELRLLPPEPPNNWGGMKSACAHGNESLGYHLFYDTKRGTEDCLYLNVYTPRLPCCARCRLPVMVYIHGGKFTSGSGNDDYFGPEFLMTEMVVLVTFNYRLGILGFTSLKDPALGTANLGLKDMVQALKWVQDNIDIFNGDKNNVTIFGSSAGGCAVHCLILSPLAKGLFHRAIMQSGSAFCPWAMSRGIGAEVCEKSGYEGDMEDDAEMLRHLQTLSEEKIYELQAEIPDNILPSDLKAYGLVIEEEGQHSFMTDQIMSIIASRSYNKVPLIIGYNDSEGGMMASLIKQEKTDLRFPYDLELLIPNYYKIEKETDISLAVAEMIKNFYYGKNEITENNLEPLRMITTDVSFFRGVYLTIKNMLTADMPIYVYRFSVDDALNLHKQMFEADGPGACHGDEVNHLFKCLETPPLEKDGIAEKTMYRMVKFWTTFARTGDPNPKADPFINVKWDPIKAGCISCMDIGAELSFGSNADLERMEFWDTVSEFIAQNKLSEPGVRKPVAVPEIDIGDAPEEKEPSVTENLTAKPSKNLKSKKRSRSKKKPQAIDTDEEI